MDHVTKGNLVSTGAVSAVVPMSPIWLLSLYYHTHQMWVWVKDVQPRDVKPYYVCS
jgi:hypothetical protein